MCIALQVTLDAHALAIDCVRDVTAASTTTDLSRVLATDASSSYAADCPAEAGRLLCFTMPVNSPIFGHVLRIPVARDNGSLYRAGDVMCLRIEFSTSVRAGGIQWLSAAQTAGRIHPMMYTQGQAILARTLFPCQDTPAVKFPYSAALTCADPLIAVCSGLPVGAASPAPLAGHTTFQYRQTNAIPAYLVTLVCGMSLYFFFHLLVILSLSVFLIVAHADGLQITCEGDFE